MNRTTDRADAPPLPPPTQRNLFWFAAQMTLRVLFTVGLRYRARGTEKLAGVRGAMLLANHQSFLDPLLVGLPLARPVSYIARRSLFGVPVVGWILRHSYVIPVDRRSPAASTFREAARRLRHGFLLGVFPEGTRSRDGSVGPLKSGFLAPLRRSTVPVFPVGIAGAHEAFPRGSRLPRPRTVCVVFGDPFTGEQVERYSRRGRESEMIEAVHRRIVACQQEAEAWRRRRENRERGRAAIK